LASLRANLGIRFEVIHAKTQRRQVFTKLLSRPWVAASVFHFALRTLHFSLFPPSSPAAKIMLEKGQKGLAISLGISNIAGSFEQKNCLLIYG
jgi:hypothetical protein